MSVEAAASQTETQEAPQATTEAGATAAPQDADGAPQDADGAPKPAIPTPSKSFAAAARRERAVQRQREAIAAERSTVAAQRAAVEAKERELTERYGSKPANPLDALKRYGWSYKDATEFALNDSQPTAEQIARAAVGEVEEMKRQRAADAEAQALRERERVAAETAEVIEDYKGEISSFVKERASEYELINLQGAEATVYAVIEAHYEKTKAQGKPRVLTIKEGADLVETWLDKQAEKLLSTSKIKARISPPKADSKQPDSLAQAAAQHRRTIHNGMTPSSPTLVTSSAIEDDRMKRALAALGG